MTSIPKFLTGVYSEDLYPFTEAEYDEVMTASAVEPMAGYAQWSEQVESSLAPSTLYIDPKDGRVKQQPEPKSLGKVDGIEL